MILYKLSTAHHFSESKARVRLCYLDAELSNKSIVFHWMHSNKFVSKVQFSRKRDSNPWEHHTISGLSGKKFVQRCERLQFQLNIWTSAIRDVSICWSLTVCYCGKHCWTNAGGKLFREIGVTMLNITMKWFMGQIVSLFRAQDHSIIIRLFILVSFSCIRQVNSPCPKAKNLLFAATHMCENCQSNKCTFGHCHYIAVWPNWCPFCMSIWCWIASGQRQHTKNVCFVLCLLNLRSCFRHC